jgi:dihydroflavonol-4-reductase
MVQEQRLPVVIVNPSTPVGPRDIKPTSTGRMVIDAVMGRMPGYVDTGLNLVHVDDVADGHLRAFERGMVGERYILGGENMLLKDILHVLARLAGRAPPRLRLPHNVLIPVAYANEFWARLTNGREPRITVDAVKLSAKRMFFKSDKAQRELGFNARPVEQALLDAVR